VRAVAFTILYAVLVSFAAFAPAHAQIADGTSATTTSFTTKEQFLRLASDGRLFAPEFSANEKFKNSVLAVLKNDYGLNTWYDRSCELDTDDRITWLVRLTLNASKNPGGGRSELVGYLSSMEGQTDVRCNHSYDSLRKMQADLESALAEFQTKQRTVDSVAAAVEGAPPKIELSPPVQDAASVAAVAPVVTANVETAQSQPTQAAPTSFSQGRETVPLVAKVIASVLAAVGLYLAILKFERRCQDRFGYRFFQLYSFIGLAVAVGAVIGGVLWGNSAMTSGGDERNGWIVASIGGLAVLGIFINNIKRTNIGVGLMGSGLQLFLLLIAGLVAAAVVYMLVYLFIALIYLAALSGAGKDKRKKVR